MYRFITALGLGLTIIITVIVLAQAEGENQNLRLQMEDFKARIEKLEKDLGGFSVKVLTTVTGENGFFTVEHGIIEPNFIIGATFAVYSKTDKRFYAAISDDTNPEFRENRLRWDETKIDGGVLNGDFANQEARIFVITKIRE